MYHDPMMERAATPPPYNILLDDWRNERDVRGDLSKGIEPCVVEGAHGITELPKVDWLILCTYDEFRTIILSRGLPVRVSFDHDLCNEHFRFQPSAFRNGMDCIRWLYGYCQEHQLQLPEWYVHSKNAQARKSMIGFLKAASAIRTKGADTRVWIPKQRR